VGKSLRCIVFQPIESLDSLVHSFMERLVRVVTLRQIDSNGKRPKIFCRFGAVHGQKVKGLVSLGAAYHKDNVLTAFFRGAKMQFEVILHYNDHK